MPSTPATPAELKAKKIEKAKRKIVLSLTVFLAKYRSKRAASASPYPSPAAQALPAVPASAAGPAATDTPQVEATPNRYGDQVPAEPLPATDPTPQNAVAVAEGTPHAADVDTPVVGLPPHAQEVAGLAAQATINTATVATSVVLPSAAPPAVPPPPLATEAQEVPMARDKRLLEMFGKFKAEEQKGEELQRVNKELQAQVDALESRMHDVVQNSAAAADHEIDERRQNERRLQEKVQELEEQLAGQNRQAAEFQAAVTLAEAQLAAKAQEQAATAGTLAEVNAQLANLESVRANFDIRTEVAERELTELRIALNAASAKLAASNPNESVMPSGVAKENHWQDQLESLCSRLDAQENELKVSVQTNAGLVEERDTLLFENQNLEGLSVDKEAMLSRARGDAEAISRATLQNKELKSRIAELEMRFVELSQKSMQYASELETARFHAYGREPGSPPTPAAPTNASPAHAPDFSASTASTASTTAARSSSSSSPTKANPFNAAPKLPSPADAALVPPAPPAPDAAEAYADYVDTNETDNDSEEDGSDKSVDSAATDTTTSGSTGGSGSSSSDENDADGDDSDNGFGFPARADSAINGGPSASSGPPPSVKLNEQAINDDLHAQIVQLEMERQQLVAQVVELKTAASESRGASAALNNASTTNESTDWPDWSTGDPSSEAPKSKAPNQDAMMQVAVIKLERELDLVKDESDELKARYLHVVGEKADLLKRIRREEELTTQLAAETDQIGDYIALYQEHRNKSNEQMKEKDTMLAELGSQNELLEVELAEMRMVLAELCARLKATTKQAPPALREGLARIAADLHRPLDVIESITAAAGFDGAGLMSLAPTARPPMIPDYMRADNSFREL
eukprot:gene12147-9893_t